MIKGIIFGLLIIYNTQNQIQMNTFSVNPAYGIAFLIVFSMAWGFVWVINSKPTKSI